MLDPTWHRLHFAGRGARPSSRQVAFETRALHESPWTDTLNLIAPMMRSRLATTSRRANPKPKTSRVDAATAKDASA